MNFLKQYHQKVTTLVCCILLGSVIYSQNITNKGKEFWVGYGHHYYMEPGQNNSQEMVLYFSAEQAAHVTVTIKGSNGTNWVREYDVAANTVRASDLIPKMSPYDARLITPPCTFAPPGWACGGVGVFQRGIHIESDVPIVAYALIYGSASSGATMLLPVDAWGYSYTSINSKQNYAAFCYSWVYAIAQEDNTVIEVTPAATTRNKLPANVPFTVTLNKGDVYQTMAGPETGSSKPEMTGTRIRSIANAAGNCYPIAVFSGSSRTSNPAACGSGGGDNDNQQLFPEHAWGKRYLLAPTSQSSSASRFQTNTYKIVVKDPATVVKRNGTPLTLVAPNKYYTFESNTPEYIESDKPVLVGQFMTGGACMGGSGNVGDPEMIIVSPMEQGINRTGFYRNDEEQIDVNYLTLIIPSNGVSSLRIDGSPAFDYSYDHTRLPGYKVVIKRWSATKKQAIVSSDSAFTAITYGLGSVESYGYNAGSNLNNLNAVSYIHNIPDPTTPQHQYSCANTPIELSVLMAYKPTRLDWQLSQLGTAITPNADVTDNAPVSSGSVVVNGVPYFKYTLPGTYKFNAADTFDIPIRGYHPDIDNCYQREDLSIQVIVKEKPNPDFLINYSGCTLDAVNFSGPDSIGTEHKVIQWNWVFPGPIASTTRDTSMLFAPGTYDIGLELVTSGGCVSDTIKSITIFDKPSAAISFTPPQICEGTTITFSDNAYNSTTNPVNEWWWDFGNGNIVTNTTGNTQTNSYDTYGPYTVRHVAKSSNTCISDTITTIVTVNPPPVVDAGTYTPACTNSAPVTLIGNPADGIFSGTGVTGNSFDPSVVGIGTHTITYTYTDGNGCSNSDDAVITVNSLPVVNAGTYAPVCVNAAAITLSGTPAGGGFSGLGVTVNNTFDPAVAGVGSHQVTYTYTDANGCSNSTDATITVIALPVVNAGTYSPVCINADPIALSGTPAGGTFSGTGVTANTFNPAAGVTGGNTITYTYSDANGCTNSIGGTITVNPLPVVDAGTYSAVCVAGTPITLTGSPAGGVFSGPGVTGNTFNPAVAGVNSHVITYTYTDENGCSNSDDAIIVVNTLPVVNAGTYSPVCVNAAPVTLNGTPAGGAYSGVGVTGNTFDPAIAGVGPHQVTYSYTDAGGCNNSSDATITVNALPVVSAGTYSPVCANTAPITLVGTPAGGTFSGPGVTGNTFNPAAAAIGDNTIIYTYTDGNGCSASDDVVITVNALPVVDAGTYIPVCANAAPITLVGTPAGGTFSGPGVTGNTFNPSAAAIGNNTITYSYTDANGCSALDNAVVTVNSLPVVNAGAYTPVCVDGAAVTLIGTPAGGIFSGPGVTGNTFNPAIAGANSHLITYSYTDGNGCSNSNGTTITVIGLPVLDAGTYAPVCLNATAITLAGSPAGGVFSGPGVIDNSFDPAVAGTGDHTITYTGVYGCSNSISTTITVKPLPVVDAGMYLPVCANESAVALTGSPAGGIFNGVGVTGNSFDPVNAGPGNHNIIYTYTDINGCTNADSSIFTVYPLPVIDAGPSFAVPQGTLIMFDPTAINSTSLDFTWTPASHFVDPTLLRQSLVANYDQTYTLTAVSAGNCKASDFLTVKILKPIKVPNSFSPNGDGVNDTWVIPNLAEYPGATVEVYNRYGQAILRSGGYSTPWDGRVKGKDVPVATYYYVIQLKNGFAPLTGSVTIIR